MKNDDYMRWWSDGRFGMMIHWGLYSALGGIYRDQKMDYIGEWIASKFKIPNKEYEKLALSFKAEKFNAHEWVSTAKKAGMKYLIYTAKHHEGFAMYRSYVDKYNIYDSTPFHKDPLKELAEECRRQGIKLGIYYSQSLDWHDKNGGGWEAGHTNFGMSWTNDWDYPKNEQKDFDSYFYGKSLPQIRELLTNYGEIGLIWFDTPLTIKKEQCQEIYDLVKRLQPNCIINSRLGWGIGDYITLGDNMIPDDVGKGNYEVAATLNDTWGYKSFDHNYKKSSDIIRLLSALNGKGVNYLLNVGPKGDGSFTSETLKVLSEVGEWVNQNKRFVYGTRPLPLKGEIINGALTQKGKHIYACLFEKSKKIKINGILSKATKVVSSKKALPFVQNSREDNALEIETKSLFKYQNPVIDIVFRQKPKIDKRLIEQKGRIVLKAKDAKVIEKSRKQNAEWNLDSYQVDGTMMKSSKPFVCLIGSFAGWTNSFYAAKWAFHLFTSGVYRIKLHFHDFMHSHSLAFGHEVELLIDGTKKVKKIRGGRLTTDPAMPYYQSASSYLGNIELEKGQHQIVICPKKISYNDGLGFCLSKIELVKK